MFTLAVWTQKASQKLLYNDISALQTVGTGTDTAILLVCLIGCGAVRGSSCTNGGKRTTFGSQFSSFPMDCRDETQVIKRVYWVLFRLALFPLPVLYSFMG